MTRKSYKRLGALTVAGAVVAISAPALAVTPACTTLPTTTTCVAGVPVSLTGLGGTRQFSVEDASGGDLTKLDLGTGGSQPFRTHIRDTSFTTLDKGYTVAATMSNLYLKSASTYNYAVKVPSSAVSIGFGSNPLAALGLSLQDIPKFSVSGTLNSCTNPAGVIPGVSQSTLGFVGGLVPVSNLALANLCAKIGATAQPVDVAVQGALAALTPAITSVLDLPTQLSLPPLNGVVGGAFTDPSFAAGTVGAGDTAGAAAATSAATSIPLLKGTPNPFDITNTLKATLNTLLTTGTGAVGTLPLVTGDGSPAQTTVAEIVAKLSASSDDVAAAFGSLLNTLPLASQLSVIDHLVSSVVAPVLNDLASVTVDSYSFPVLNAAPTTSVAGVYDGTMTVTFVQS